MRQTFPILFMQGGGYVPAVTPESIYRILSQYKVGEMWSKALDEQGKFGGKKDDSKKNGGVDTSEPSKDAAAGDYQGPKTAPPKTASTDTVPIMATPGEHVMNVQAANMFRPLLEWMNQMGLQSLQYAQSGGEISRSDITQKRSSALPAPVPMQEGGDVPFRFTGRNPRAVSGDDPIGMGPQQFFNPRFRPPSPGISAPRMPPQASFGNRFDAQMRRADELGIDWWPGFNRWLSGAFPAYSRPAGMPQFQGGGRVFRPSLGRGRQTVEIGREPRYSGDSEFGAAPAWTRSGVPPFAGLPWWASSSNPWVNQNLNPGPFNFWSPGGAGTWQNPQGYPYGIPVYPNPTDPAGLAHYGPRPLPT